jgi:preprotein translocase subunit SecD
MLMRRKTKQRLWLILLLLLMAVLAIVAYPKEGLLLKRVGINENLSIRRGLDLQGGAYLVYEADFTNINLGEETSQEEALNNAKKIIEERVNPGGVSESVVRVAANNRIIIELPGVKDPNEAIEKIGRTAQLSFFEVNQSSEEEAGVGLLPTDISGDDIERANVEFIQGGTARPVVTLKFKSGESAAKLSELTARLSQSGNLLVVFLDQQVVFGPANTDHIPNGEAQLSGNFEIGEANDIADLLNAGALPVPIDLVAQRTIGPSLGALSIKQSVVASFIGIISIAIFIIAYYKKAGIVAVFGLLFYALAMVSVIKLSAFTQYVIVLNLAGIAGFILSIAVAVDTNILIFERLKEELKRGAGSPLNSFEHGFDRAWQSIRDANVTTLISCAILYYFGTPAIRGFAVMLGLGVALNIGTAWTITKAGMRFLARSRFARGNWIGKEVGK